MSQERESRGDVGWWLEPGPDMCEHCLRAYYVEVGYVCAACDRPVCPVCAVTVRERGVVLCPSCAEEEG